MLPLLVSAFWFNIPTNCAGNILMHTCAREHMRTLFSLSHDPTLFWLDSEIKTKILTVEPRFNKNGLARPD